MSELERRLLAKLTDPANVKTAWQIGVRAEHFETPLYQSIWKFTTNYWREAQMENVPSQWALTQEYPGYTLADDATDEVGYYAERLRQLYVTNVTQELARKLAKGSVIDPNQALQEVYTEAYAAIEVMSSRLTRVDMIDNIEERWERYENLSQFPQGMGVPYGLDLFDMHTGGILPSELAVVAAFAKTGKTMFLLNAAVQAKRKGYTPIVFTLELSLNDTQQRLDAMYSGISYNRLTHGHHTDDEKITLRAAMQDLAAKDGILVERPEVGDRTATYLCSRAREVGADYLIIDQLSKMEAGHKTFNKKERYASILEQLKNDIGRPGRELPCLMAVQLRRGDDEPTEESFADAAEIERDVDIAFALHRNRDLYNNHKMILDILVSRRTDTGRFLLDWELTEATRIAALHQEALV